jgi:hypothetical protein
MRPEVGVKPYPRDERASVEALRPPGGDGSWEITRMHGGGCVVKAWAGKAWHFIDVPAGADVQQVVDDELRRRRVTL